MRALPIVVFAVVLVGGWIVRRRTRPSTTMSPEWLTAHAAHADRNTFEGVCWTWPYRGV